MEGWTQKQVEAATGITQPRISSIRRGYRGERATLEEITKIERACGRPLGFVLGFAGVVTVAGVKLGHDHARLAEATEQLADALEAKSKGRRPVATPAERDERVKPPKTRSTAAARRRRAG